MESFIIPQHLNSQDVEKTKRKHCMCCTKRFYALRKKTICFYCSESFCLDCIGIWQPKNLAEPTQVLCKRCIHSHGVTKPVCSEYRQSHESEHETRDGSSEDELPKIVPVAERSRYEAREIKPFKSGLILSPRQRQAIETKRIEPSKPLITMVQKQHRRFPKGMWHTS